MRTELAKIDYGSEVKKKEQHKCADRVGCLFSIENHLEKYLFAGRIRTRCSVSIEEPPNVLPSFYYRGKLNIEK